MIWTFEQCVKLLKDKSVYAREWAAERLGEVFWDQSLDVLKEAEKDNDENVRRIVKYYVERIEEKREWLLEKPSLNIAQSDQKQLKKYLSNGRTKGREIMIESISQGDIETISLLVSTLNKSNDTFYDSVIEILSRSGERVLLLLREMVNERENENMVLTALCALQSQLRPESVEILKENFDFLWDNYYDAMVDTVTSIGSKEFLPLLEREAYPGEIKTREAFYRICAINHISHPLLVSIRIDMEKQRKKEKMLMEAYNGKRAIKDIIENCVYIQLKCTNCGKTYRYEVNSIVADTVGKQVYIEDSIRCKNCNALDKYNFTEHIYATLNSYSGIIETIKKDNPSFKNDVIKYSLSLIDGKKMSIPAMLSYYKKKITKEPQNAEHRVGVGNILLRIKKYDEAEKQFLSAIDINKNVVEAYYSLGRIKEFFHDNFFYLFYHNYNVIKKVKIITEEGDDVKLCETIFTVRNFEETVAILSGAEDFMETNRSSAHDKITSIEFVWLAQLSKKKELIVEENSRERFLILQSQFTEAPLVSSSAKKTYTASITLKEGQMITNTTSEPRMIKLKERFSFLLGENIKFKNSSTKEIEEISSDEADLNSQKNMDYKGTETFNQQAQSIFRSSYMNEWMNTPIPALGGKTPFESVKTSLGRNKVEILLREIENSEAHRKKDGMPYYDVSQIRKKLGL